MQLQDLEIFQQLFELRSINATARALGFAQSNITARLQSLEREFDIRLFTRSHQGIVPTTAGAKFYRYALDTLRATAQVRTQIHRQTEQPHAIISTLLFNYLINYRRTLQLNDYQYQLMSSTDIQQLNHTTAATVITYAHFQQPNYVAGPVKYFRAAVLTAKDSSMPSLPLLVNSDRHCPFRARSLRLASQISRRVQEIDSWDAIINLVQSGRGIALLPEYLAATNNLTQLANIPRFRIPYRTYTRPTE
ncbi:LysR family transcriptional regulator [Lacticaseibacillus pantheris]|uniref:LysR family transcriptional regulator n=1 Tax=Lacticaseibacillus pantheris TaxID=171523 RepID=UPI002658E424|nr:LysR family transcriptional regulator [Lacticaseibacillus pantheris]WKF85408.1 LysR family transcriptional regulator [Lacticaseibacillus pantheris]